jgi:hypothetical protein
MPIDLHQHCVHGLNDMSTPLLTSRTPAGKASKTGLFGPVPPTPPLAIAAQLCGQEATHATATAARVVPDL